MKPRFSQRFQFSLVYVLVAAIVPPNTMLAMSRWTLMGIHVKLLMAAHTEPLSAPESVMPAGEIMNVTHELATNRIAVPRRFESTPRLT
jgi:hypothetical protein